MTATASTSTSLAHESRQEAGPLPSKRGEIGFVFDETIHSSPAIDESNVVELPPRHPADHDPDYSPTHVRTPVTAHTMSERVRSLLPAPSVAASSSVATTTPPTITAQKSESRLLRLCPSLDRDIPGGFQLKTVVLFTIQSIVAVGTIAGWAISVDALHKHNGEEGRASSTFVHVVFAVMILGQFLFLERRLFRLRAEHYVHLYPGATLPTSRRRRGGGGSGTGFAFTPWNRPSLPTYAAALAESGAGTGDVEDNIIAVPPPPAYGHTRGSTMLLQGFMTETLRAQRPRSVQSMQSLKPEEVPNSRPISYRSTDEAWEAMQDAERARRLEETLTALERPHESH